MAKYVIKQANGNLCVWDTISDKAEYNLTPQKVFEDFELRPEEVTDKYWNWNDLTKYLEEDEGDLSIQKERRYFERLKKTGLL